jgi:cytochrome c-type biogenesis protein CcmH/NrfG
MKILIACIHAIVPGLLLAGCAALQQLQQPQQPQQPQQQLQLQSQQQIQQAPPDPEEQRYLDRTRARPDDPDAWFRLGNYYALQNQWEKAEQAYREVLQRTDHNGALHNLGLVQVRMGAKALQDAAAKIPPQDPVQAETREFLRMVLGSAY